MAQVVKITFEDLKPFKHQSLAAWCRWAIGNGFDPNARVEVYRNLNQPWELAGKCIADVSKLTVIEDAERGPYFAKYHPLSSDIHARRAARHAPYSDLNSSGRESYMPLNLNASVAGQVPAVVGGADVRG